MVRQPRHRRHPARRARQQLDARNRRARHHPRPLQPDDGEHGQGRQPHLPAVAGGARLQRRRGLPLRLPRKREGQLLPGGAGEHRVHLPGRDQGLVPRLGASALPAAAAVRLAGRIGTPAHARTAGPHPRGAAGSEHGGLLAHQVQAAQDQAEHHRHVHARPGRSDLAVLHAVARHHGGRIRPRPFPRPTGSSPARSCA